MVVFASYLSVLLFAAISRLSGAQAFFADSLVIYIVSVIVLQVAIAKVDRDKSISATNAAMVIISQGQS